MLKNSNNSLNKAIFNIPNHILGLDEFQIASDPIKNLQNKLNTKIWNHINQEE